VHQNFEATTFSVLPLFNISSIFPMEIEEFMPETEPTTRKGKKLKLLKKKK
jgi:hypothetical protein